MVEWNPGYKLLTENLIFHKDMLGFTYSYAENYSQDISTKTGAAIVSLDELQILGQGANHFPTRPNITPEEILSMEKKEKYDLIDHAEEAAIKSVRKNGLDPAGTRMYMPWVPCTPCANLIIDAGITELVSHKQFVEQTPKDWRDSCGEAIELLLSKNVSCFWYDGKIGNVRHLLREKIWHP